jgi:hypothetical protein
LRKATAVKPTIPRRRILPGSALILYQIQSENVL